MTCVFLCPSSPFEFWCSINASIFDLEGGFCRAHDDGHSIKPARHYVSMGGGANHSRHTDEREYCGGDPSWILSNSNKAFDTNVDEVGGLHKVGPLSCRYL